ncbi:MAG: polysaccharide export protein [Pelosinus sp.]|nr:polysaccharide export protein [Pelosinus sp.]
MKIIITVLSALLLVFPLFVSANDYHLCSGDVVSISIISSSDIAGNIGTVNHGINSSGMGFNGLSLNEVIVRPDGKLAVPLVGEIKVEGLSPSEVSAVIIERLNTILVEPPSVAVNVVKFHTTRVYVLGEVNHPGLYEMDKGGNLIDALAMAGGWTKDAAKKKVFIIHKNMQSTPIKVNVLDLLEKGDTRKNLVLNYGDIVYLSGNGRIDFVKDIVPYINTSYEIMHW